MKKKIIEILTKYESCQDNGLDIIVTDYGEKDKIAEEIYSLFQKPIVRDYFDKIQKGFKKLQDDCSEVRLVGFCQKDEIPDEAHKEDFEEEFDHEYQILKSDGFDEASFWGDIYLQLDRTLYMRFDVNG